MKRVLLVVVLLLSSCASSAALKNMCIVQKAALTRYVEAANPELSKSWQEVGNKLVRNQGTINKLVGAGK